MVSHFSAQLQSEIGNIPGAVGPHIHWERSMVEEAELAAEGEGELNHVRIFRVDLAARYLCRSSVDRKQAGVQASHRRPAGELVQLDHFVAPLPWRNAIADVCSVLGAAFSSSYVWSRSA